MAFFITDENSTKGRDPNINIINSIHNIKRKNVCKCFIIQHTNKHITFNKGKYVGHLEPAIEDSANSDLPSHAQLDTHSTNSVTNQCLIAEQVKPDTFHPPQHKLKPSIESNLTHS